MAETIPGGARFEIGAVLSRAFGTIGSNLLLFCGLAIVLAGIPQLVLQLWQLTRFGMDADLSSGVYIFTGSFWTVFGSNFLVATVTSAILQAALTRATVQYLSGETPQFGHCLMVGLRLLLPMVAMGLLAGIGLFVGFALLIVPGIVLWTVWAVITPAYVQEKIGIFEAFGRSATLTSGSRWQILAIAVIVFVLLWVVGIPFSFLTAAMTGFGNPVLLAAITAVLGALRGMVVVAVTASVYVELRQLKEGIAPAELEAIFA
jgi:hypothetical protein